MSYEFSEDNLIERTAIEIIYNDLKWDTVFAFNSETFRDNGSPGRHYRREVVLKRYSLEILRVEQWSDKTETAAAVYNEVFNKFHQELPHPTYEGFEINRKTELVYEHLKKQYFGGSKSIYGKY